MNILFAAASIFYTLKDPLYGQIIYIIIFIIFLWFVLHTTIISDKNPKRTKKIIDKLSIKENKKKEEKLKEKIKKTEEKAKKIKSQNKNKNNKKKKK